MGHVAYMIGALSGTVFYTKSDTLILMIQGVGYLVYIPPKLHSKIHVGDELTLYIHTHVRDDTLSLFGFATDEELRLFELLLTISGIGPKTALPIIDRGVGAIQKAVRGADVAFFTSIPRLGTKNAQKIIIELKSKLGSSKELDLLDGETGETQEILEALMSMGFSRSEVKEILTRLPRGVVTVEEKIRAAFRLLGRANI